MKRLHWIETFMLPLALAALTVSWLTLWVKWIMLASGVLGGPAVPGWLMLITIAAGAFVTRRAIASVPDNLHLQRAQRVIGLSGLAAVVGVLWITFGAQFPIDYFLNLTEWGHLLSPEAIALVVAGLLWWRGIRIGRDEDLHASAQREFFGGVVALTVLFIANKITPALSADESFWPVMIFFAVGLGAMAVAGLEQDRRLQKDSTGTAVSVNRHWLGTVGGIIGLILVGGTLAAAIAAPETLTTLNTRLDAIGVISLTGLGFAIYYIVLLVLPIINLFVQAVLWPLLQTLLRFSANAPQLDLGPLSPEEIAATAARIARTPPFRFFEVIVLLCIAVFVFMVAVRRFRLLATANDADEIRESVLSRELLWSQLKSLFARQSHSFTPTLPNFLTLHGPPDDPRLIVRRAYQSMLTWATARNLARAPRQTPMMYAEALYRAVPSAAESIARLTAAYLRARYGEHVTEEEAGLARQVVEQLQTIRIE
ncbi:MAG TPA: DUF4129 domain-containing protein [Anaerolineales bacterium]|nr:DUF4129 domain-containing protein [Anaerolineales bacterium]